MNLIKLEDDAEQIMPLVHDVIVRGGVVAGPTDTVYGIFGRADDENVIKRMFEIKKRPEEKAFPIFVKDIKMARWYAYISDSKARLLETFWPGPVTFVFHHKEKLPAILTGGGDSIGMRIPRHPLVLELLQRLDVPLAQSSANITEQPSPKNVQEVFGSFEVLQEKIDLFVDGGEVNGESSVIIDLRQNTPRIVRAGLMTREELDGLLHKIQEVLQT